MSGRRAAWSGRAIVVAVSLALAHDLAFLARYGSAYGEALAHAGHGRAWTNAVLLSLFLGVAIAIAAGTQLWRLRGGAGAAGGAGATSAGPTDGLSLGRLARSWAGVAASLGIVVGVLLTVQEHLERAAIGIRAADPAILASAEYPGALAIVAGVAAAVGFVVALFRWRRDTLLARIRAAATERPRPIRRGRPAQRADAAHGSILGRSLGLRAPPSGVSISLAA